MTPHDERMLLRLTWLAIAAAAFLYGLYELLKK
jgi:hypothetical protein